MDNRHFAASVIQWSPKNESKFWYKPSHLLRSHVRGSPFELGPLHHVLSIVIILISDQAKVSNLQLFIFPKHDVGGLAAKEE